MVLCALYSGCETWLYWGYLGPKFENSVSDRELELENICWRPSKNKKASIRIVLGADVVWRQKFGISYIPAEFCLWKSGSWCPGLLRCGTGKRIVRLWVLLHCDLICFVSSVYFTIVRVKVSHCALNASKLLKPFIQRKQLSWKTSTCASRLC
jgi:hypothetical protein